MPDTFDQMLDAIIKARNDSRRWEQTCHLLAQALLDLSNQDGFQSNTTFKEACPRIQPNRPKQIPK